MKTRFKRNLGGLLDLYWAIDSRMSDVWSSLGRPSEDLILFWVKLSHYLRQNKGISCLSGVDDATRSIVLDKEGKLILLKARNILPRKVRQPSA